MSSKTESSPFKDKIVLVTGASSGMGKSAALYLAQKGVRAITLMARTQEKLEEVAAEIATTYPNVKTLVLAGDASKDEDNKAAVARTVDQFGGITGAFINAGIYRGGKPIEETDDAAINETLDVNVKGVLYALRHLIPAIKATVGDDVADPSGSIVVNSSCMAEAIVAPKSAGSSIYSASKAFVNSIVETAAIENAPRIRVNGVMPGVVRTGLISGADDATYDNIGAALQPLWGRAGKPEEISSLVAYLLGDEASFISGANIMADGLWSKSGGGMGG